ncbi:MAG TPA: enolase C-terminal domain-like protein, partial [Polyangiaceae bacterium]
MTKIRNVRAVITAPGPANLVVVKVETEEPELYGLGCATFTQRALLVQAAVEEYLKPLLVGRDADQIEELWQLMTVNSYWRNGPVLNNALGGVDMALWDIKGKRAKLPLCELWGGKYRAAVAVYRHADGADCEQLLDCARAFVDDGIRHVRIQLRGYGGGTYCGAQPSGALSGATYDPRAYMRSALEALDTVRAKLGNSVELIHDVHERLKPAQAVEFAKLVEPIGLFYLEDLLAPEDVAWLENVRQVCTTPLALGELFVHPIEWISLFAKRLIDFMRMHVSAMGGITPARKAAAAGELFGVRTAWHGPPDLSPLGQAANLHLDLVVPNFGVQEFTEFPKEML